MMPSQFFEDNSTSRKQLETLVRGLADADIARMMPDGWSVSSLIAHLSFWERRVFVLLRRWKENGVDDSPIDSTMTNDALKPMWLALDPRKAIELCLSAATETDAEIETLTPELLAAIEASPTFMRLNRSLHRMGHIAEIEAALR